MLAIKTPLSMPCFSGFLQAMRTISGLISLFGDIDKPDVPRMSPKLKTIPEYIGLTWVEYN